MRTKGKCYNSPAEAVFCFPSEHNFPEEPEYGKKISTRPTVYKEFLIVAKTNDVPYLSIHCLALIKVLPE